MSFFGKWSPALLAAVFLAAASGCSPMDQGPQDEEKEPHFVLGKSRVNAMDYAGAIRAFEESLEANPHSGLAHYQLAMLFENQESDPAAAIYHYQQYLKYDPKAENADVIAQRITRCKQQLAEDSLTLPSAQYQNTTATPTQVTSPTPDDVTTATTAATTVATSGTTTIPHKPAPQKISKPRTHTVVSRETLASIARKYSITLAALEAANPGVNPKKLRAGQVINLPAP